MASRSFLSRPCGTSRLFKSNPGLASWAKFSRPFGTKFLGDWSWGKWFPLEGSAGDGGDDQYFIAVFECVFVVAEKTDVFFVDVEIDESPNLAVVVAEVGLERGKAGLDFYDQLGQILGGGLDLPGTVGVFLKGIRQDYFNGHMLPLYPVRHPAQPGLQSQRDAGESPAVVRNCPGAHPGSSIRCR